MSSKNQVIYGDFELLERLDSEFREFVGRETYWDRKNNSLTVYALPKHYKKKAKMEAKARSKREEDFNPEWDKYTDER